ncbi:MAG: hypothetical protein COA43_13980 [Robiginitomaculum sp.]|nr:MAG: hypothetical protein COA43_13980 [Robiginitomaculum sp.]
MALKHLLLMRHAKSSWQHASRDHERPLNERGHQAARAVGASLRARNFMPSEIWSSDSQRTRETVAGLCAKSEAVCTEYLSGFYLAPANKVMYLCQERGEPNTHTLMLLGHNPGWEEVFCHFTNIPRRFPSGGCAVFTRQDPQADWLDAEAWRLVDFIQPRDLV